MSDSEALIEIFAAIKLLREPPVLLPTVAAEMTKERCLEARTAAANLTKLYILGEGVTPPVILTENQFRRELIIAEMVAVYLFWTVLVHTAAVNDEVCGLGRRLVTECAQRAYAVTGGHALVPLEAEIFRYCGLEPIEPAAEEAHDAAAN